MPFVVGGIAAMVALAAGVMAHVDPVSSLVRALLAFMLGWIGAQVWHVILILVGQNRLAGSIEQSELDQQERPAA
ncbi:MAG: hypothetical protein IT203_02210 [Fimbriimonadaceae bacterium]|nr:hypothetical protein [Fimbriimonadaceae bacterium]